MPKLLLCDVDGTLVCPQRRVIDRETERAIQALQARGVLFAVATGRAPYALQNGVLGALRPDFYLCINGMLITDASGGAIYERRLSARQVLTLAERCAALDAACCFSFEDGYYAYHGAQEMARFYAPRADGNNLFHDGETRTRHEQSLPFGAFTLMPPEEMRRFCEENPELVALPYESGAFDVFPAQAGKETGACWLLDHLGLPAREMVAIGDGFNDLALLRLAGVGVAMGNAPQEVRRAADEVTETVQQNGVLRAIERHFAVCEAKPG